MKLIIDANIIFSFLIKPNFTRRIILLENHELYTPEFVVIELFNHISELEDKTSLNREVLLEIFKELFNSNIIRVIKYNNYKIFIDEAESISPDPYDIDYFALALKFDCAIWSNDKKLKQQNKIKIFSTKELLQ